MNFWSLSIRAVSNALAFYLLVCLSYVNAQQTDIDGRWDYVRSEANGKPLGPSMITNAKSCQSYWNIWLKPSPELPG